MVENVSSGEPADSVARLAALIGQEHVSADYVRFRIELLKAQTAVRAALIRSATQQEVTGSGCLSELPLDRALLRRLLGDLSAALAKCNRNSPELARLSTAAAQDAELLEQLVRTAAFAPDQPLLAALSKRLDVGRDALLFFGRVLSAPFVAAAVGQLKQRASASPSASGCCPFCGSPPGLATLKRENGRRVLCCALCGESWEFARTECPFCESRSALGSLSVDESDPYFIETCDLCNGYLKTVDERKLPEDHAVLPLVATTASLHLDLIAEKEGYARALPYAALR